MKLTDEKVQKILDWEALPPEERNPKTKLLLAKSLGISRPTLDAVLRNKPEETADDYDTFMAHLKKEVFKFNCPVRRQEIYMQLMGWKTDNKDGKNEFELDATSYNKIATEVTERLRGNHREWGGICPVCGLSQTLRNEPRLDSKPEHTEDREVETVALSVRPD